MPESVAPYRHARAHLGLAAQFSEAAADADRFALGGSESVGSGHHGNIAESVEDIAVAQETNHGESSDVDLVAHTKLPADGESAADAPISLLSASGEDHRGYYREAITDMVDQDTVAGQVAVLAKWMAGKPFAEVMEWAKTTYDTEELRCVSKYLAENHFWCSMFVYFVEAVEKYQEQVDKIRLAVQRLVDGWLKEIRERWIVRIATTICNRILDKSWTALFTIISAHIPVLGAVGSAGCLRCLRMLALLTCPDPAKHEAVVEHAVEPLENDGLHFLSTEVKRRAAQAFPNVLGRWRWASDPWPVGGPPGLTAAG